jgi:hypothetical protein
MLAEQTQMRDARCEIHPPTRFEKVEEQRGKGEKEKSAGRLAPFLLCPFSPLLCDWC